MSTLHTFSLKTNHFAMVFFFLGLAAWILCSYVRTKEPGGSEPVDHGGDNLHGHGAPESTIIADDLPIRYAKTSKPFNVSLKFRRSFVPKISFIDLETHVMNDFVFVMAASSNHFNESVDAVASILTHMPEKRIIYYDLGLKEEQITEVKRWCSVTYRLYDFSGLPEYVHSHLRVYAWKMLLIRTVMSEFKAVFYVDASFRLVGTDMSEGFRVARKNDGFAMFHRGAHSIYAVTHPDVYQFLPTDFEKLKKARIYGSGIMLIYGTEKVFRRVLWWFYLCALDERCLVTTAKLHCESDGKDGSTTYENCHRFDQSIINLLLWNNWMHDSNMEYVGSENFFDVDRSVTHMYNIETCNENLHQKPTDAK